ncbi:uncharacterized protein LY79DRAFT_534581 [Colletotrichum navitas]|uniref:Uncharacterized protein n=1 Tax=Colletotrichum navitas TaxID=681940 RepID=A0AAD8VAT2_9PEZI|nr:uncharacterized protein LY79DRAFT_534581 [Colletotrichum navitas]KAK1600752.1 hypothetical protein LY79DRAFT_534581 [Colletotrichum navitas]
MRMHYIRYYVCNAGDLENEGTLCQLFTTLDGITVNVRYRRAPEHPLFHHERAWSIQI